MTTAFARMMIGLFFLVCGCTEPRVSARDPQILVRQPSSVPLEIRVSAASKAKYVLDTRYPDLGMAYRDPRGLIWGEFASDGVAPLRFTRKTAEEYCAWVGGRLPSRLELEALAKDMKIPGTTGFSYKIVGADEMSDLDKQMGLNTLLPGLGIEQFGSSTIWSSADDPKCQNTVSGCPMALSVSPSDAKMVVGDMRFTVTRCVVKPGKNQ